MADYWQALRLFSPSLRRFLLTSMLATLVAFGLVPVLQNLFLLRLGFDARSIGLLAGLGQIVWAAAALPASVLSTRLGLRNGLRLGFGFFALGLALLLLVESLPASLWLVWLMGSIGVMNLGVAFISVSIPPYLMAVTGDRERPYAFAAVQVIIPSAALLGSLLAGLLPGLWAGRLGLTLDDPAPYRLALWLGPFLVALGQLPLLHADPAAGTLQSSAQPAAQAVAARLPLGRLGWLGGVALLAAMGDGTVRTFFNVYLDRGLGVAPATIGTVMGLAQLLPIAVAFSLPLLLRRWGSGLTLLSGLLGLALVLLPLAFLPQVSVAALAYMAFLASTSAINPARDLFGQELVQSHWRTTSQAVSMLGAALGWAMAGLGGGLLVERLGFGALFASGALLALLGAGVLAGYLRTASARLSGPVEPLPVLPEEAAP